MKVGCTARRISISLPICHHSIEISKEMGREIQEQKCVHRICLMTPTENYTVRVDIRCYDLPFHFPVNLTCTIAEKISIGWMRKVASFQRCMSGCCDSNVNALFSPNVC